MKIVVDGRKVRRGYRGRYYCDDSYTAYFRKGLTKRIVLHEFYHHLDYVMGWHNSKSKTAEEREARRFAKEVLSRK